MVKPIILNYIEYPISRQGSKGEPASNKPMLEMPITEKRKIACLIDSGADRSISFKNIGEVWFGLKFNKEDEIDKKISGFHSCPDEGCEKHPVKAPQYLKPISFKMGGKNILLNVIWIDRGQNLDEDVLFVLGRDFFDYFDVLFKQREEQVWLYPRK
ncbi:MAG TPA: hypothetical protein VJI75_03055 [Candidatus Nanoarchaeia archaeon]|nr:hypothetical protein [Candidatus Nanoarchaeia archaeon]